MDVSKPEFFRNSVFGLFLAVGTLAVGNVVDAQGLPGGPSPASELHVDPVTGDVYRRVTREVVRPVVDERIEREEKLVYRPETVKETRPEYSTTYKPVTEMKWMPYLQGRWNVFRQPAVAYRQVPETRWEARSEVINRTTTKTRWVPEKRTVEIPHRTVRYERTRQTDVELVAKAMPQPNAGSSVDPAIVARLQPLGSQATNAIAVANPGPPNRDSMQTGMPTKVLNPNGTFGVPPSPYGSGVGIATVPSGPIHFHR
jgi:hypothetical protein